MAKQRVVEFVYMPGPFSLLTPKPARLYRIGRRYYTLIPGEDPKGYQAIIERFPARPRWPRGRMGFRLWLRHVHDWVCTPEQFLNIVARAGAVPDGAA